MTWMRTPDSAIGTEKKVDSSHLLPSALELSWTKFGQRKTLALTTCTMTNSKSLCADCDRQSYHATQWPKHQSSTNNALVVFLATIVLSSHTLSHFFMILPTFLEPWLKAKPGDMSTKELVCGKQRLHARKLKEKGRRGGPRKNRK